MCDYSLHHVASRPAKVGDKLLTSKFFNTPTGGFAAVDDVNIAVCLLPGTEIAFEQDVEWLRGQDLAMFHLYAFATLRGTLSKWNAPLGHANISR